MGTLQTITNYAAMYYPNRKQTCNFNTSHKGILSTKFHNIRCIYLIYLFYFLFVYRNYLFVLILLVYNLFSSFPDSPDIQASHLHCSFSCRTCSVLPSQYFAPQLQPKCDPKQRYGSQCILRVKP